MGSFKAPWNMVEGVGQKIKKTILFTIELERMKHLGINLTKEASNSYTENYKCY